MPVAWFNIQSAAFRDEARQVLDLYMALRIKAAFRSWPVAGFYQRPEYLPISARPPVSN